MLDLMVKRKLLYNQRFAFISLQYFEETSWCFIALHILLVQFSLFMITIQLKERRNLFFLWILFILAQ